MRKNYHRRGEQGMKRKNTIEWESKDSRQRISIEVES